MVWYVSVSGASSHSLMPGPACPNARPGHCPDCRAQTRGAQQSITRTTCAQFSRGSERGDSPVVGDHRELRVSYKSDPEWIIKPSSRLSPWGNYPPGHPMSPHTRCMLWVALVTGRAGPVQSWVQGQSASLDLSCTRSGSRSLSSLPTITAGPLELCCDPGGAGHTFISGERGAQIREMGSILSPPRPCPEFLNVPMLWWSNDSDPTSLRKWLQARGGLCRTPRLMKTWFSE